jgi:hypothetical protein
MTLYQKMNIAGLLVPSFDKQFCLSRYRSVLYGKASPYFPSTYLLERLREHEALQKKCRPHTELYRKAVVLLSVSIFAVSIIWTFQICHFICDRYKKAQACGSSSRAPLIEVNAHVNTWKHIPNAWFLKTQSCMYSN